MFIGHFALGLAAKRATPRLSLALLFAAAQFADLLWPVLVFLGVEQVRIDAGNTAFTPLDFASYPYSHSLLLLGGWGIVLGLLFRGFVRDKLVLPVVFLLVVSHWVLDFVTHRPDLPLFPGGPRAGLGLWNSIPGTLVVETLLYAAGLWIYSRTTRPRDRVGRWAFAGLAVFLMVAYLASLASGPPPSVTAVIAAAGPGGGLLLLWARWLDRHRDPVP
jgi:hypothetical protein